MVQTPHANTLSSAHSVCLDWFSVALTNQISLISFPAGTKMFQFPAFPILSDSKRKSYSEILGSKVAYTSPRLNAVSHVLHQRLEPSPPPDSVRST